MWKILEPRFRLNIPLFRSLLWLNPSFIFTFYTVVWIYYFLSHFLLSDSWVLTSRVYLFNHSAISSTKSILLKTLTTVTIIYLFTFSSCSSIKYGILEIKDTIYCYFRQQDLFFSPHHLLSSEPYDYFEMYDATTSPSTGLCKLT